MKHLTSQSGETLVETLASILICAFAAVVLATSATAASKINADSVGHDEAVRAQQVAAELQTGTAGEGTITLTANGKSQDYKVTTYSAGDNAIVSYEAASSGSEG